MHRTLRLFFPVILFLFAACGSPAPSSSRGGIFVNHDPDSTGVTFFNPIDETDAFNYFTYPYMYLGAGVATADFDNNGFTDLLFTGNMTPNHLYLNQGEWHFEEVAATARIAGDGRWYTGVTIVDINNDGWQDVYLSVAGKDGDQRNELYVNLGADAGAKVRFEERGEQYGIAGAGPSIQSAFFDYDGDGDLDLYVITYPPAPFSSSNRYYKDKMTNLEAADSDHLYRNDGDGTFTDVSEAAGVANYGLSLGLSVADFNDDGLDDIYVSNDFSTPDRYFQNNGDGTFTDRLTSSFFQTSLFGMGTDAADVNNDGRVDLMQADMTPKDNRRAKENMASMNREAFADMIRRGFHHQYMYNALQLNRGGEEPYFSNVAQMAGLSATDWSWGPLLADFDNDGFKDFFITNGIKREVNNRDFHNALKMKINFGQTLDVIDFRDIPSEPVANFAYRNDGELTFTDVSGDWGLDLKGFSNGCTYADLDNDGDLDLAVSNIDAVASVYENQVSTGNSLRVELTGPVGNRNAIGAVVSVTAAGVTQTLRQQLTRGYQSAVSPALHFGVGPATELDAVTVRWPDGATTLRTRVPARKTLSFNHADAARTPLPTPPSTPIFAEDELSNLKQFRHVENKYNDYTYEPLLPYRYSRLGPALATGDVNGDGLDDLFLGGAYQSAGQLLLQTATGEFEPAPGPWIADKDLEDTAARFFDADGDGDQDLYVASGGGEFFRRPDHLQDRLYLNQGDGQFTAAPNALPSITAAGGCVETADVDGDGDLDLFVGGRHVPGEYPLAARSYLLQNDGSGRFIDATETFAPGLLQPGMVTAAVWSDHNADGRPDLILTGEWMNPRVFTHTGSRLEEANENLGLTGPVGWFQSVAAGDFDGDGDPDYIFGNLGKNYKYHAAPDAPFTLHSDDFDGNGRRDIVFGYHQNGELFPLRGRQCSAEQIPAIENKFRDYHAFAEASLADVYGHNQLENALSFAATEFGSLYVENTGDGAWKISLLPTLAQLSSVHGIVTGDYDGDGHLDAVLAGNLYSAEVETPRNDAGLGVFLRGDGAGNFTAVPTAESGLFLPGDVKNLVRITVGEDQLLVAGRNDDALVTGRVLSRAKIQ